MRLLKQYASSLVIISILIVLFFVNRELAKEAVTMSVYSIETMLGILPPLLIVIHCIDVLVSKEVIIKHMGEGAGFKGYLWAMFLGTFSAGPLYVAFPIAAMLSKKGANLTYIIFFLGIWTTTKLPIFLFELNFFGLRFTFIHGIVGVFAFYGLAVIMDKWLLKDKRKGIYKKLSQLA